MKRISFEEKHSPTDVPRLGTFSHERSFQAHVEYIRQATEFGVVWEKLTIGVDAVVQGFEKIERKHSRRRPIDHGVFDDHRSAGISVPKRTEIQLPFDNTKETLLRKILYRSSNDSESTLDNFSMSSMSLQKLQFSAGRKIFCANEGNSMKHWKCQGPIENIIVRARLEMHYLVVTFLIRKLISQLIENDPREDESEDPQVSLKTTRYDLASLRMDRFYTSTYGY